MPHETNIIETFCASDLYPNICPYAIYTTKLCNEEFCKQKLNSKCANYIYQGLFIYFHDFMIYF